MYTFGRVVRIHHLDGGTFCPVPGVRLPTHVLAIEFEHNVVLVDVGLGNDDVAQPVRRLGPGVLPLRPVLRPEFTVARQLQQLGVEHEDVTDVVATHLDYDHVGGLSDFPSARLHVSDLELDAARHPRSVREAIRYRRPHIDRIDQAVTYHQPDSDVLGLPAHPIDAAGQLYLIPMPGHTRGHAAIAVRDASRGWLIAAGDAAMHRHVITGRRRAPLPARLAERALAVTPGALADNHRRLGDLSRAGHRVFCSHDPVHLRILQGEAAHG